MNQQQALSYAKDMIEKGMTVADANIEVVRMMGVRIVQSGLTRDTRAALNAGVKTGRLGHLKKDGTKPEAYFHPNSLWVAMDKRCEIENHARRAMLSVCA